MTWARSMSDKTDLFAGHLEGRFLHNTWTDTFPTLECNKYDNLISLVSRKELAEEILSNLDPKKALEFDWSQSLI